MLIIIYIRLVTPVRCANNLDIKGKCKRMFVKLVDIAGKLEEVCHDWAIKNLKFENDEELQKFWCILGNE